MEDFAHALANFVRDHQAWAAPIVLLLAFGESLAFISLLIPAWGALVAIGALIGASGISFWPLWIAGGIGAALGDWVSYWFGYKYKEQVAQIWPLSRYPDILPRGEAFVRRWGVPSIFIGRFFGPLRASVPLAAGIFEMPYLAVPDRQFRLRAGLGGGAAAVRRRHRADHGMALARGLSRAENGYRVYPRRNPHLTAEILDEKRARPYSRAHDDTRDHPDRRSPPPLSCGMGGRLRLRSSPLPPDHFPRHLSRDQDTRSSGGSFAKQELAKDVYAATFQVRPGHKPRVRASARIRHDLRVGRREAGRLRAAVLPQLRR